MNRFESALENNALRKWVRELMEVKPMRAATDIGTIDHALHIACGNGGATDLLLKHFTARRVSAVDQNPIVIAEAQRTHPGEMFAFSVQNVLSLSFADGIFDAAFDLADLHNYPDWQRGVMELKRVLKPGGLLILEEITQETFAHGAGRLFKALTEHPYEAMLTMDGLRNHVADSGFEILYSREKNPFGLLRYIIMVARKR